MSVDVPKPEDVNIVFKEMYGDTKETMLQEFQDTFGASKDPQVILRCLREEVDEAAEALAHLLKEFADIEYVATWAKINGVMIEDQGLAQDLYTMSQYMQQTFYPAILDEAFSRVHQSNMSKLGEDGKPIYREDGKVLKGPNYQLPNLLELI